MVRTREYLSKFFSDEVIDQEIDRVNRAKVGDSLFSMESWEIDDFVVSILKFAKVNYDKKEIGGMIHYIKTNNNWIAWKSVRRNHGTLVFLS